MTSEHNLEVTGRGFDAYVRGDGDEVLRLATEDVEIYSSRELANPGTFHGTDGYLHWLGEWLEAWDNFELEVTGAEPVGERHVVTTVHQTATGKGSGVPVELDMAFVTEVDGDRFSALHLYPTREAAIQVATERESGDPRAHGH